jgi:hypothetical protein
MSTPTTVLNLHHIISWGFVAFKFKLKLINFFYEYKGISVSDKDVKRNINLNYPLYDLEIEGFFEVKIAN